MENLWLTLGTYAFHDSAHIVLFLSPFSFSLSLSLALFSAASLIGELDRTEGD